MTIRLCDKLMYRRCKGQNGDIASPFDGDGDLPLVLGTVPGNPPGDNLTTIRHKIPKDPRVFVIDIEFLVRAEPADLPSHKGFSLSIRPWFVTRFFHPLIISLFICSHVYLRRFFSCYSTDWSSDAMTSVRVQLLPSTVCQRL